MVPLLIYSKSFKESHLLDDQENFATIGQTILDNFDLERAENSIGQSILSKFK